MLRERQPRPHESYRLILKILNLSFYRESVMKSSKMLFLQNWDQTGSQLVPVSQWTLAEQGSTQVPDVGKDDKREIAVLLAVSASGTQLPPQPRKTPGCHAKITFPRGWHITHSGNHCCTEETMLQYIDHVVIPYFSAARRELELPEDQVCLAICCSSLQLSAPKVECTSHSCPFFMHWRTTAT